MCLIFFDIWGSVILKRIKKICSKTEAHHRLRLVSPEQCSHRTAMSPQCWEWMGLLRWREFKQGQVLPSSMEHTHSHTSMPSYLDINPIQHIVFSLLEAFWNPEHLWQGWGRGQWMIIIQQENFETKYLPRTTSKVMMVSGDHRQRGSHDVYYSPKNIPGIHLSSTCLINSSLY